MIYLIGLWARWNSVNFTGINRHLHNCLVHVQSPRMWSVSSYIWPHITQLLYDPIYLCCKKALVGKRFLQIYHSCKFAHSEPFRDHIFFQAGCAYWVASRVHKWYALLTLKMPDDVAIHRINSLLPTSFSCSCSIPARNTGITLRSCPHKDETFRPFDPEAHSRIYLSVPSLKVRHIELPPAIRV